MKHPIIKYGIRSIATIAVIYLLLLVSIYVYIRINKTKLLQQITTSINQQIHGTVSIGNMDITLFKQFPSFAVQIEQVNIKDSLYAQHQHTFFQAEKMYAKFSFLSLIQFQPLVKKLVLEKANIYLYTDSLGYSTEYLLQSKQKKKDSNHPTTLAIDEIELKEVQFVKSDQQKKKLFNFNIQNTRYTFFDEADHILIQVKKKMLVNAFAFNTNKGSFLANKKLTGVFDIHYNKKERLLHFEDIHLQIDDQPFTFTGKFHFTENPQFKLDIKVNNIQYNFVKAIVTPKIAKGLSVVDLAKPIHVQGTIE